MSVTVLESRGDAGETDKKQKVEKVPVCYGGFEAGEEIAERLIKDVHPYHHLVNIKFICRNIAKKKNGKLVPGNVYKVNPMYHHLTSHDFIIEVALEVWNEYNPQQRTALIDHLMMRIEIVENEQTGNIKKKLRSPDIQEFTEVIARHHTWTTELEEMETALNTNS